MASHSNVVVNFGINANASGSVNVFGSGTTPSLTGLDMIIADVTLPVSDFYATSNALISYQGSNDAILGVLDATFQRSNTLATDINTMLGGAFNCSNAIPYSQAKYSNIYNIQSNFGMFALGYYADKLFGHLAATAAIANDSTFISYMNGAGSNTANLGTLLTTGVYTMSSANATNITKQVLGQDASRAMNADNDFNAPNTYQPLKWISGDVIFMGVTLMPPTVTYNSGQLQRLTSITTSNTYYVKITLGDGTGGVISGSNFSGRNSNAGDIGGGGAVIVGGGGGETRSFALTLGPGGTSVIATFDGSFNVTSATTYTTNNGGVTVNASTGAITGSSSATITGSYVYGGVTYSSTVNYVGVAAAPPPSISSLKFSINGSTISDGGSITLTGANTTGLIVLDQSDNDVTGSVEIITPDAALGYANSAVTPTAAGTYTLIASINSVVCSITVNVVASGIALKYASNDTAVGNSMTINDETLEVQLVAVDSFGTDVTASATWSRTNNGADSVINVATQQIGTDQYNNNNAIPTFNANTKGYISKLAPGQDVLTVSYLGFSTTTVVTVANYLRVAWTNQAEKTYRIMGTDDGLGINYYTWNAGTSLWSLGTTSISWSSSDLAKLTVTAATGAAVSINVLNYAAGFANAATLRATNGTLNGRFLVIHS
jgi:hypothetical protein